MPLGFVIFSVGAAITGLSTLGFKPTSDSLLWAYSMIGGASVALAGLGVMIAS